jgi:thiol-disulfide isomerase/thioredoxin
MTMRIPAILAVVFLLSIQTAFPQSKNVPQASTRSTPRANYGEYDFTFTTLDGKTIKLSDYAGKVVLVNIWAPWCGPCKMETPGFAKLYKEYKSKGFEILGVAVQTDVNAVRAFLQKYEAPWPIGLNQDVATQYKTYGLPDNYLFNPDGTVARHFVGYTREDVLRPALEEALKKIVRK